jgi:hypothetical protein
VAAAVGSGSEEQLLRLIEEEIEGVEENVRAKEAAINGLAQLYVDQGHP